MNERMIRIIAGVAAFIAILSIIITCSGTKTVDKLRSDLSVSQGKNIVHEINAQKLKDSIANLGKSYQKLSKYTDSLVAVYQKKVSDRDGIIEKYKKQGHNLTTLSALGSMEHFNSAVGSLAETKVVTISPDTVFAVPVMDIRTANGIFLDRDKAIEMNDNYARSEISLTKIIDNLKLEVLNREQTVTTCNQLVQNKETQNQELNKQIADLNKINKKSNRKHTIQKIGIGVLGFVGIVIAASL